jgi:hypothetical protein
MFARGRVDRPVFELDLDGELADHRVHLNACLPRSTATLEHLASRKQAPLDKILVDIAHCLRGPLEESHRAPPCWYGLPSDVA